MKEAKLRIEENRLIAENTWRLTLSGAPAGEARPGQFVNLRLRDCFLRRPLSVADAEGDGLTLIYKVVGRGTAALSALGQGEALPVLLFLGNGFDPAASGQTPLLVGGGAGVAPLYLLARRLRQAGRQVTAVLGFNRATEVFLAAEFNALGVKTVLATADGSMGVRGFVTDGMKTLPEPMLRAVYAATGPGGQYSFEERMGCGFGACMGCSCETLYGPKRICRDGPVLQKEEIRWPT